MTEAGLQPNSEQHGPYCALCGACKVCEQDTECWSQDWDEDGNSIAVKDEHLWNE